MTGLFLSLGVGLLLTVVLPLLSFVWASKACFRAQQIEDRLRRITAANRGAAGGVDDGPIDRHQDGGTRRTW